MKISNLLNKDLKLVEKKKIWFIIPTCIVTLAIAMMLVFGFTIGEPLNLGMDFSGGYAINVKLSTRLNSSTESHYTDKVIKIIEGLKDKDGKSYNLKVNESDVRMQGENETASLYVRYKAAPGADDTKMNEEINPAIEEALSAVFKIEPTVTVSESSYKVEYVGFPLVRDTYNKKVEAIKEVAKENNVTVSDFGEYTEGSKTIVFTAAGATDEFKSKIQSVATIDDYYSGQAQKSGSVSATVSGELLTDALLAISLAIVLMLIYIAFRFEVSSGLSAIVALLHDILIMFSFMAIFHIEINSTFIAALITILGYSINNTIIVFDRIRENMKSLYHKNSTASFIANQSIRETLMRSINTSVTTLLTITMVAIIGVSSIRIFALPIIVGLLAGTFSSIFISPSIWAMWKDRKLKSSKTEKEKNGEGKKAAIA